MYSLKNLDAKSIKSIEADWIEQININDDSNLELTVSNFDHIISSNSFGDLLQRSNLATYIAVIDSEADKVIAITEVIFARQGAKTICKIMEVFHAPSISALEDEEYQAESAKILISILGYMLEINKSTNHGITKIFARDDAAQYTIKKFHDHADKQSFRDLLGFEVRLQGHQWLEFKKIS
ncbi:hypothetical protein NK638_00230 [Psychrobacter sp. A3]|uniref:hypothetical protein n=1 Tax=Psychrobacter sp. A3 TaxID=2992754 RepID=UPI00237BCA22|nr:hypothetical protein [Psychrobacter sp. A3]MDE0489986.1 hypothetical protein [Psychrobacter sp. A3]